MKKEDTVMVDEIKLDKISVPVTTQKMDVNVDNKKDNKSVTNYDNQGDVTVTNHIGKVITSMLADNSTVDEQARVIEMKQRVQSGSYRIDTDALSETLYKQVFSKSIGG